MAGDHLQVWGSLCWVATGAGGGSGVGLVVGGWGWPWGATAAVQAGGRRQRLCRPPSLPGPVHAHGAKQHRRGPLVAPPASALRPAPPVMQLPPTVISEQAARAGLSRTLFERLQVRCWRAACQGWPTEGCQWMDEAHLGALLGASCAFSLGCPSPAGLPHRQCLCALHIHYTCASTAALHPALQPAPKPAGNWPATSP